MHRSMGTGWKSDEEKIRTEPSAPKLTNIGNTFRRLVTSIEVELPYLKKPVGWDNPGSL